MTFHSVPDPNKTYLDRMTNHELAHFEILKVTYSADGSLVANIEANVTIYQTMKIKYNREQLISQMRQQGNGFYFKGKPLHLDWVGMIPYIHHQKTPDPRDILE